MFTRLGFKIGLTISLALVLTAAAQKAASDWHTFTDPTGHFSFLVPDEPQKQTQKDESHKEGPIVTDTYVAKATGNAFIAGFTQYPESTPLEDQPELTADRDNFNKEVKATVTSEERKTFSGFPAVEFKSKSDQAGFHALMMKAGHHAYCTEAVYKGSNEQGNAQSSLARSN